MAGAAPGDLRAAVVQPRLDGRGGLEKYCVYLIDTLRQRLPVDVIVEEAVDLERLQQAFGVRLDGVRFVVDRGCHPPQPRGGRLEYGRRVREGSREYARISRPYDLLFGHGFGLPWPCAARRGVLVCHFPLVRDDRVDAGAPRGFRSLLSAAGRRERRVRARLDRWARILVSSDYARRWVRTYWDRDAHIIHPPIEQAPATELGAKRPWIVGAGFFAPPESGEQWGYKRQEVLIDAFRRLCASGLSGWELHLAGHTIGEREAAARYLAGLRERAAGCPVFLHADCPHEELLSLYRHGSVFWHATGYGVVESACPEKMEHFGMVTAEAMGWGCVPVVIRRGGQPEIVQSGASGRLWDTLDECVAITAELAERPQILRALGEGARRRAGEFSVSRFRERVNALLDEELTLLRRAT